MDKNKTLLIPLRNGKVILELMAIFEDDEALSVAKKFCELSSTKFLTQELPLCKSEEWQELFKKKLIDDMIEELCQSKKVGR